MEHGGETHVINTFSFAREQRLIKTPHFKDQADFLLPTEITVKDSRMHFLHCAIIKFINNGCYCTVKDWEEKVGATLTSASCTTSQPVLEQGVHSLHKRAHRRLGNRGQDGKNATILTLQSHTKGRKRKRWREKVPGPLPSLSPLL